MKQTTQMKTHINNSSPYALVRANHTWHRLALPMTIGRRGDIMINTAVLANIAYRLEAVDGTLQIYHYKTRQYLPVNRLEHLGLQVWGPYPQKGETSKGPSCIAIAMNEWGAKEEHALRKLPSWFRTLLGCSISIRKRWALRICVLATTLLLLTIGTNPQSPPDLSQVPMALTFGKVHSNSVGASPSRPGYEQGIVFHLDAPNDALSHQHLLSFKAAGLNIDDEVTLLLNGGVIFQSDADTKCITSFCDFAIPLAKELVKPGMNRLQLQHNPPESAYFVSDIHLGKLDQIKEIELQQVQRWLQIAERHYSERDIVAENLVVAIDQLDKTLVFLQTRVSEDSTKILKLRAEVLKKEATEAFAALAKDLWNRVKVNQKLEKYHNATKLLEILLTLYPNPNDSEHIHIKKNITQIKELDR